MVARVADPAARILALVDGHGRVRADIEARIARLVAARWSGFDGWYRDALVAEIAAEVAAAVGTGQVGIAQVTDAYLAQVATIVRGTPVSPVGVAQDMRATLRAGEVTAEDVQARVAAEFRWQVSKDVVPLEAKAIAVQRAVNAARTDMGLAFRDQTAAFMDTRGAPHGYRRVIRPERSEHGTCGLCVAASNQVYHRRDLLALHGGCKCTVVEIGEAVDEGRVVNDAEYAAVLAESDSTRAADLRKVRVQVSEHGELGPVLTDARHEFRGPSQVAA